MRSKTIFSVLLVISCLSLFMIGGCGSGNKGGASQGGTATSAAIAIDSTSPPTSFPSPPLASTLAGSIGGSAVATVGTLSCRNCHRQTAAGGSTQIDVYSFWEASQHANQGVATTASASCKQCHDPFDDGAKLAAAGFSLTNNAMVGCEACHGGGSAHWGIGPLPAVKPGAARCGACHGTGWNSSTSFTFHKGIFPEGNGIYEDYVTSPHARSINSAVIASGTTVTGVCSRCHTDEGAKVLPVVSGTLNQAALNAALTGRANIANASPVQCRTCHIAHDIGTLTAGRAALIGQLDTTAGTTTWSPEFKTCTYCHQLLQADGTSVVTSFHDPTAGRIITDTHFSVAGTPGYRIDPLNARACSNCHNPHKADNTINNQYAQAGHLDPTGNAWIQDGDTNSTSCARCHTTTGYIGYINAINAQPAGSTGNTALAAPAPSPAIVAGQKQMLYCNGCHVNNKGGLRTLPYFQYNITTTSTFVPNYTDATATLATGVSRTIPSNIGASLLCASCHSGRRTAQSQIKNVAAPTSFSAEHYLVSAAIMWRLDAYEYTGVTYENAAFQHELIGTAGSAAPGNGNGPCTGCHMYPGTAKANHAFKVVTRSSDPGPITAVLADASTCSKCHTGANARTPALLNLRESQFKAAIQALRSILAVRIGVYYRMSNGSFYSDTAQTVAATSVTWGVDNTTPAATAITKNRLGAGWNLNILAHALEGASALYHNPLYVKRLIYDSIDFVDDGTLNNSVATTVADTAIILPTTAASYTLLGPTDFQITDADRALALQYLGATRP